jgi:hypothetical protein
MSLYEKARTFQLVAFRELRRILDVLRIRRLGGAVRARYLVLGPGSGTADILTKALYSIATGKQERSHDQGKEQEGFHGEMHTPAVATCHPIFSMSSSKGSYSPA